MTDISIKKISSAITIQKWYRGTILRKKQLPLIMFRIKRFLNNNLVEFSNQNSDGRVNSSLDEQKIIELLKNRFNGKIKPADKRMWYDILVLDRQKGWIPVNIKTTTTKTSDNTGNFAMCVHAYTNEKLDYNTSYSNGKMSELLLNKIKSKQFNKSNRDYYFLVLNKTNPADIIINSLRGLSILTSNINNLPFQICWQKNRIFKYELITKKIKLFINCLKKPKPGWREEFMKNIRNLEL